MAQAAIAAPHEIKVFTDELAAPGAGTLEIHANKASRAGPATGLAASPWQLMPEYSYGIAAGWELSLQLPMSMPPSRLHSDGWRVELQYVGWRAGRWHFAANPGITHDRDGPIRATRFSPAVKAAYRLAGQQSVGVEYFRAATPVIGSTSPRRSDMLYLAWDGKLGRADINLGVGRGLNPYSDRWVVKSIVEFGF